MRWQVLSDQKIKMGPLIRVEKLSFWESFKIHDLVGTPTASYFLAFLEFYLELRTYVSSIH